jgi:hypothetical protein
VEYIGEGGVSLKPALLIALVTSRSAGSNTLSDSTNLD